MSDTCPDCGGDGLKYVSMCDKHKLEAIEKDARRMGVTDMVVSIDNMQLLAMRKRLSESLSGYLLVKVLP